MDQREFLAMLDERLGDGRAYPTLDDYSKALESVRRMRRADIRALTTVADILDPRNANNPDFHHIEPPRPDPTRPYMLESSRDGVEWHLVGNSRYPSENAAQYHAMRMRQLRHVRIVDTNNMVFIRLY